MSLNTFKKNEVIQKILSDHKLNKIEIKIRKISGKFPNI